jgi:predicted AlkP superfamily pyrophosphatase or phosphodiesterase
MHVDHNPLKNIPTLFDVFRKKGIKYSAMEFPIISNNKGTGFFFTFDDFKQFDKIKRVLKKNDVVYDHIWGLDRIEHKYGLHSKEALNYLKKLDGYIKDIYNSEKGKLRIILFSDHGGCEVTKTKDIKKTLEKYDSEYFLGSTNAHIWLKDKTAKEELKKELKKEGYIVYDDKNIEKELKIPYKREYVGDLLACVKPGEQIYPDFFRDTEKVKSMHGYTTEYPELDALFIMNGFGTNKKLKNMRLLDISPTILKAMKIEIPKIWDGKARI